MIAILYIPLCVFFAWLNAKWISEGKRIYHALNGLVHLTFAALVGWLWNWAYGLAILFIARVVFDSALNLFRRLSLGYVSPKPKSIVDRLEKKLFGNDGITPKLIYILIIICLLTIR